MACFFFFNEFQNIYEDYDIYVLITCNSLSSENILTPFPPAGQASHKE